MSTPHVHFIICAFSLLINDNIIIIIIIIINDLFDLKAFLRVPNKNKNN